MHTQFSDDLMNQILTQRRKINSYKLPYKRENVMARRGPSSGCLSAKVSCFPFPGSSQRLGEKRREAGRQEEHSSFIYGRTEADFMAVGGGCFLGSEKISHSHFQLLARGFVLGE